MTPWPDLGRYLIGELEWTDIADAFAPRPLPDGEGVGPGRDVGLTLFNRPDPPVPRVGVWADLGRYFIGELNMIPACAHLTVSYNRDNGWSCRDCGTRFVIDRHAPLTPWSTLAAVVEERNRYFAEVAALRAQVEELMRCGVSIAKAAQGAVDYERERVSDILTRMASDAHDTGNDAAADALALAALAVQA